ncbi:RNA polymerase sigma-70 factor, ECF subfamily [bacterium A37T11]|nr:RNA polymerase sigma-70 factor, ECF subfamily [bacterium A37T11]
MADYRKQPDQVLFALIKDGSERAFAEIYERYWELLLRHALKMIRDEEQARDLVQDLFLALWEKREQLNTDGKLSSFLYSALRNRIFNFMDYSKVRLNYLNSFVEFSEEGAPMADETLRLAELEAEIEQGLAEMPERMRKVFELSRKEGLSYKEIAAELHISENTVKVQVSKALAILRKYFFFFLLILVALTIPFLFL